MLSIRSEKPEDVALIYELNKSAFGLGPMAIKPTHQRRGIGTKLFNYWLNNFDNVVGFVRYLSRWEQIICFIIWWHLMNSVSNN